MNFPCRRRPMRVSRQMPGALALIMILAGLLAGFKGSAQIDPDYRSLFELGYDQPLTGRGPQRIYAYFYYIRFARCFRTWVLFI